MTEIIIQDEGGDTMKMIDFGDFRSSLFGRTVEYIRDVNDKLPNFRFRDVDILLLSYPKCGCTWMFEILTMLMKGKAEGPGCSKMDTMLEAMAPEHMDAMTSPRLLNSHLPYRRLPKSLQEKKVKIVFVARNPKDAAVSLYNMMSGMKHYHYEGTFKNWLPLYIRGNLAYDDFFRYHRDYEQVFKAGKHEMTVVYYEDLKKDLLKEVTRLSDFIGVSFPPKLLEEVAAKCQFKDMKSRFTVSDLGGSSYKPGKNYGFMRKGEVGDWKNWFTVAQNEMMDAVIKDKMNNSMFTFKYEL